MSQFADATGPVFDFHPHHAEVTNEVHARPVHPLGAPSRVRRIAFALGDGLRAGAVLGLVREWCTAREVALDLHSDRHLGYAAGAFAVTIEVHTEFVTVTWITGLENDVPFPDAIGLELFAGLRVLLQTRIDITTDAQVTPEALEGFSPISLCHAHIDGMRAQFATDFRADDFGFTRYELAAGACSDLRRGMIVRRLLEIETYRVMAMMGLPEARAVAPLLEAMEAELGDILSNLAANATIEDHQKTLARLNDLSERTEALSARTSYRFAASHAYGEILRRRIRRLDEQPIGDYTTVERYLSNRVEPALATCRAIEKRQQALLDQAARATDLLGTRINLDLQIQNKSLLDTISGTTSNQYKLQTTVENLSTIAISYYGLGILSYVLAAVPLPDGVSRGVILAVIAPFMLVLVYLGVRRIRRSHLGMRSGTGR